MAFIKREDYDFQVGKMTMEELAPSARQRIKAENAAMEEMAGYLRDRFDTVALFAQEGDSRNDLILMYLVDMAIYHLFPILEMPDIPKTRSDRYNAAIQWLVDVSNAKANPNLPEYEDEEDEGGLNYGSGPKQKWY